MDTALLLIPPAGLLLPLTLMLGEQAFSRSRTFLNWLLWSEDPLPPLPDGPVTFAVFWESLGPLFSVATAALLFDILQFYAPPPWNSAGGSLLLGVATSLPAYVVLLSHLFDLWYGRAILLQLCVMALIPFTVILVCGVVFGILALVSAVGSLFGIIPS